MIEIETPVDKIDIGVVCYWDGFMEDLIKSIAQALVDHPEQLSVKKNEGERTTVYELKVAKEDIGKIIGQHGRNIDAIRTILTGASSKGKKRSILELIENDSLAASSSKQPVTNEFRDKSGRKTGVVRWFNDVKGYGFITMDDGQDVFVHYRSVEEHDQRLVKGDQVIFEVVKGDKGLKAVHVKIKDS